MASTLNTVAPTNTKLTVCYLAPVGLAMAENGAGEPSPTTTDVCESSRTPESLMDVSVQNVPEEETCHGQGYGVESRKAVSIVPTKSCMGVALSSTGERHTEILRLHLHVTVKHRDVSNRPQGYSQAHRRSRTDLFSRIQEASMPRFRDPIFTQSIVPPPSLSRVGERVSDIYLA